MTACKFESLSASSGRQDGFRLTPLRMCSCGRGLVCACLLIVPWSVRLGRPAESRGRPGRAHGAVETAIPVALVVDFRALQAASNGLGAPARSWCSRHRAGSSLHIPSGSFRPFRVLVAYGSVYPMRAYVKARRGASSSLQLQLSHRCPMKLEDPCLLVSWYPTMKLN